MRQSRRHFLEQVSTATVVGLLAQLPARRLWALAPAQMLPEPDEALLRKVAQQAMDAARAAGAAFADIRLTAARYVSVRCSYQKGSEPGMGIPSMGFPTRYGIRAIVDGAWGFAAGTDIAADAIVETARTAVAVARGNKPRRRRTLELAPVERVSNGVWTTPIEREPLTVPIGEQGELGLAALHEVAKIPEVVSASTSFQWRRPTSVLATTDGTMITFRYTTAFPAGSVWTSLGEGLFESAGAEADGLRQGPYGYEALNGRAIIAGMRGAAERAIARVKGARKPVSVDVGRYDLVFGPDAVSSLLTTTLARAVDAELALGYRANTGGTSYAAPPGDLLGRFRAASPLITLRGDRTRPGGAANVAWDEEGVTPRRYTFVQDGVVVDYHTNRETAPQLADWYRSRGEPPRAHGLARRCGSDWPGIFLPNMTLEPGSGSATVTDLVKDVKKGLYIERATGSSDQQLINTQFSADHMSARSITNGKLGGYVKDLAFQFTTTPFWKSIDAVGGRASVKVMTVVTDGGALLDPVQPFPFSTFELVPLRARQVNVLNTGRTA